MAQVFNRAKVATVTTGVGVITLGAAESGFQTFADAGAADGDVVRYAIEDGANWEIGTGTYTTSGTTLSRTVIESSNADAAISLSGSAKVFITVDKAGLITEHVHTLTGTTPALDPNNGTVQTWTLTANSTPTDSLTDGQAMTLHIEDGTAYTITWPTMEWVGGSAPTLPTTGDAVIVLWKVGSSLFGQGIGDVA